MIKVALIVVGGSLLASAQFHYQGQANNNFGQPIPSPAVRVCTEPATGTTCSPLATVYSDNALTHQLTQPFQGDQYGNISFFAATAGPFHLQISGPNVQQIELAYTYLPGLGGGGSGSVTQVNPATGVGVITNLGTFGFSSQTTTPLLTVALTPAAQHTYFGNNTGSTAAPAFLQPSTADLSDFPTQTGNNGKVLGTNGSVMSWVANGSGTVNSGSTGQFGEYLSVGTAISGQTNLTESPVSASGTLTYAGTGGGNFSQIVTTGNGVCSGCAGTWYVGQGSQAPNVATSIGITGPVSVTSYNLLLWGVSASGMVRAATSTIAGVTTDTLSVMDFPDTQFYEAASCNNATATAIWSIGSGGTTSCRAGSNNAGAFVAITDTVGTFAQFTVTLPEDWDTASRPFVRFVLSTPDNTAGHTIIPQIQVSCAKGDGSTTDDTAFNAAHPASTITTNTTVHQFWSTSTVQLNSTDTTGCVAGSMMTIQVGRATDTASAADFYGAFVTVPRVPVVQAN